MTTTPRQRARVRNGRARPFATAAFVLAVLHGALRIHWQVDGPQQELSPRGGDLIGFGGWNAIGLCAVAALAAGTLATLRLQGGARRALLVVAGAVSAVLLGASAMLLLDVVGGILPGLEIRFYPLGALSRAAGAGTAVLLFLATLAYRRESATGGSIATPSPSTRTPHWAYLTAYLSVAGCLGRVAVQGAVGFGETPLKGGTSAILFEVGFVLGGTLLPLALAHSWGLSWLGDGVPDGWCWARRSGCPAGSLSTSD